MKHFFIGVVFACLGIWGIVVWWDVFGLVMRGVVPFCLVVFGLVAILSGLRKFPQQTQTKDNDSSELSDNTESSSTE